MRKIDTPVWDSGSVRVTLGGSRSCVGQLEATGRCHVPKSTSHCTNVWVAAQRRNILAHVAQEQEGRKKSRDIQL